MPDEQQPQPEKPKLMEQMNMAVSDEVRIFFCLGVAALLLGLWACAKLHMENAYSGYSVAVMTMFTAIVARNIWGK